MYSGYRIERRRFKRVNVVVSAKYRILSPNAVLEFFGDQDFEAETMDLSEGGLAIKAANYLPRGTTLGITLVLFEPDYSGSVTFYEPLELTAKITSSILQDDYTYRLGLCVTEINEEDQSRLTDLVHSCLKSSAHGDSRHPRCPAVRF